MDEAQITELVTRAVSEVLAQRAAEQPEWHEIMMWQAGQKVAEAFGGACLYLIVLWILGPATPVGRWVFPYSDEVKRDEEEAKYDDPAYYQPARANLARVNSARILGFAAVFGLILAF